MKIKSKCPLESTEAKKFWQWSRYHPIAKQGLFHTANERKTTPRNGRNLKLGGLSKGIPDYFLAYPIFKNDTYKAGLFIELKRADKSLSRLTVEQAQWLAYFQRVGYQAVVAYGADEAIRAVEEYLR